MTRKDPEMETFFSNLLLDPLKDFLFHSQCSDCFPEIPAVAKI